MKIKAILIAASVLLVLGLFAGVLGCAQAPTGGTTPTGTQPPAEVIEWTVVSEGPAPDPWFWSMQRFYDQLNLKTGGRWVLTDHPTGVLHTAAKAHEFVQVGGAQMANTTGAYWADLCPTGEISYGLPGSPLNSIEWYRLMWEGGIVDLWRKDMMDTMGLYLGGTNLASPGDTFFWHEPFTDLASLKGRTVRLAGGFKTSVVQEAMGMTPTMISRAEVEAAMALGTLDGAATSVPSAVSMGWYESAPYIMEPRLFEFGTTEFIINADAWNALPEEFKTIYDESLREHHLWETGFYGGTEFSRSYDTMRAAGCTFITLPEADIAKIRNYAVEEIWPAIAAKGPYIAQAIDIIKDRCIELGLI